MSDTPFAEFMARIRSGDARAAQELVRHYESAIRLAVRTRLTDSALKRQIDSVDICQSVLASFFVRAGAGQYDLTNPAQLIALLVRMARNKLVGQTCFHQRQRRMQLKPAIDRIAADLGLVDEEGLANA
jgi:RNA polymerase sigma-70 factor (ECF subfamily)